jgi:pimeloyl-ACP methyl ester carboxylesterase
MGGEISVFEEDQLEKDLEFLSKDESLLDLFQRSLSDMCNVITKPKPFLYDSTWLTNHLLDDVKKYLIYEENILFRENTLHYILWIRNYTLSPSDAPKSASLEAPSTPSHTHSNILIIYIHTNGRASPDAIEILPLCDLLNCNLLAFDGKGCGKSNGQYAFSNASELSFLLEHILKSNPHYEIILWGRGMGTNTVIEYLNYSTCSKNIKFVILDSPFTSLHDIVYHAATSIDTVGLGGAAVPAVFVKFALFMMRKRAKAQLGMDPYLIRPLNLVSSVSLPCYIMSADEDDYIPDTMGKEIAQSWNGKCWYRLFPGSHLGERDPGIVMSTLDKIIPFLTLPEGFTMTHSLSLGENSFVEPVSSSAPSSLSRMTVSDRRDSMASGVWKSDSSSSSCDICQTDFTLMNRRHHCRNCGSLVCHSCSKRKLVLVAAGTEDQGEVLQSQQQQQQQPVRVCDICYDGLTCCQVEEGASNEMKVSGR